MGPKLEVGGWTTLLAELPPTMPTADDDGANTSPDDDAADPLMMKAIMAAEDDEPATGTADWLHSAAAADALCALFRCSFCCSYSGLKHNSWS